jgi:hypothetical protein
MGEVYRAKDTKIHREVAIKVLPIVVASSPERLIGWLKECRRISSRFEKTAKLRGHDQNGIHSAIPQTRDKVSFETKPSFSPMSPLPCSLRRYRDNRTVRQFI